MKVLFTKWALIIFVLLILNKISIFSQQYPTKEVRAIWVATVMQLDWPKSSNMNTQKSSLINIIQSMKNANFNTVVLQIRSRGDLMYPSTIEPWAASLTNSSGIIQGTDPGWDPLQFAIDECHKRGMELHAWWNVYNVASKETAPTQYGGPKHVAAAHPDWVKPYSGSLFLDPGLPEVRQYLVTLAMDMIRKYDIDAIHFDYIRYPDVSFDDAASYAKYGNGMIKNDWRRENINQFVRELYDSAMAIKPMLKVGSAPIGNYKAGVPGVGSAWYGYTDVFQDSRRWMQEKKHDYLAPQIYWNLTGNYPFHLILQDWVKYNYGRHIYGGVAAYVANVYPQVGQIVDTTRFFKSEGNVFFRYDYITPNNYSAVRNNYAYPANIPPMAWKDSIPPNPAKNLRIAKIDNKNYKLQWDSPLASADGDLPKYYNVYRSSQPDFNDAGSLLYITVNSNNEYTDIFSSDPTQNYFYTISALDKGNNESVISNITSINSKLQPPVLASPVLNSSGPSDIYSFSWSVVTGSDSYRFQLSKSGNFINPILDTTISGTLFDISGLENGTKYYWRAASKESGIVNFSEIGILNTATVKPVLAYPLNNDKEINLNPILSWNPVLGAVVYKVQVAPDSNFHTILYEKSTSAIYLRLPLVLNNNIVYYWRVNSTNSDGLGRWSEIRSFTTEKVSAPVLVYPADLAVDQPTALELKWNKMPGIQKYSLQVAVDSTFTTITFADSALTDTVKFISGLKSNKTYYWRAGSIFAENQHKFSGIWSFGTMNRQPQSFSLVSPFKNDTIKLVYPRKPLTFKWKKSIDPDEGDNVTYNLQIRGNGLNTNLSGLSDTTYTIDLMSILATGKSYQWNVESTDGILKTISDTNIFFTSNTTTEAGSKTDKLFSFNLSQNYPNPFNPVTNITYSIPKRSMVSMRIYNILGKEVMKLANENKEPGLYNLEFNGKDLPSGVYFYKLECISDSREVFRDMKKMILIK